MCNVCGCGEGDTRIEGHSHGEAAHFDTGHHRPHHPLEHRLSHAQEHQLHHDLDFGGGPARAHVPGMTQTELVRIEQDILSRNDGYADLNKRFLGDRGILTLNLVSSPGSGKTTLLTTTIKSLSGIAPVAVIEGDQETANDAECIRATGAAAVQINTGRGCHLDAHMIGHALETLDPESGSVLFIENVGNLVCPASFALGENHKVVILSVTEGEDKPLKYPDMFAAADLMIVSKIDLLPYVDFDLERCVDYARRVNSDIETIMLSARSGEGIQDWVNWIFNARERAAINASASPQLSEQRARIRSMPGAG